MSLRSLLPFSQRSRLMPGESDPFTSLHREINRLFDDFTQGSPWAAGTELVTFPRVDVRETKNGLDVTAELPGMDENDVTVEMTDQGLVIKGEKKAETEEKDETAGWHRMERSYGTFMRTVPLPFEVEHEKAEATFDKGVLKVHLPRSPEAQAKTRRIAIKSK